MWLLPSRSRPHNLERFFSACTRVGWSTPGVVICDYDDPMLERNRTTMDMPGAECWSMVVVERKPLGELYNTAFKSNPTAEWFGFLGDDVEPQTARVDAALVDCARRGRFGYCADDVNDERSWTHGTIPGEFARREGWLALPGLDRLYVDTVWQTIARREGLLEYLPQHRMPHLHFSVGAAPRDEIYAKPSAHMDRRIYEAWRRGTTIARA
jgi:hypothetical protein